jgi:hypothetical protein
MPADLILFEPRRQARLAAAAVAACKAGFGGTMADQRRLLLVHGPQATAGQVLATISNPSQGEKHV